MKLQDRNLSINLDGADVALLQRELRQINFTIPDDEARRSFFGRETLQAVQEFQKQHQLEPSGVVDEQTAAAINAEVDAQAPRVVRGTVTNGDGRPVADVIVRAFDKDLRSEELLGQVTTRKDGRYEIKYTAQQFARAEKNSADLIVRVLNREEKVLLATDIIFNAEPLETIDLILDNLSDGVSEYERYLGEIRSIRDEAVLTSLNEEDVRFIAGETGINELHVAYLATAHQYTQTTKINSEAFYGLFRQNLPTNLPALLMKPTAVLRRALESSIEEKIIPLAVQKNLDRIVTAIQGQANERLLRNPDGQDTVPRLLSTAGLSQAEQETFLASYLNHTGSVEELWRSFESTPLAAKVKPLQATLQLGLITQNNAPLLEVLQTKNVRSIRDVARFDRKELQQLLLNSEAALKAIPAGESEETNEQKVARYVNGIYEVLEITVPTAFVRAAFEKSSDPARLDVARVLSNAPDFELRDNNIEKFLAENPQALEGIADPKPVTNQLKALQRVMRITPRFEEMDALMSAGLNSAADIVSLSPAAFVEQFGNQFGDATQAQYSYGNRAFS
ncbi:MAG: peptidoglycan-binding protein [Acidobacteria bacterium]|nr:peptidoglycan-binding protein [Acidobacteriota bacterium]